MIVVNRFRVEEPESAFREDARAALGALARRPGYVDGHIGRNVDDPGLWVLTTTGVTSAATAGRCRTMT